VKWPVVRRKAGEIIGRKSRHKFVDDPLAFVDKYRALKAAGLAAFAGGLAGFFGYDTVRYSREQNSTSIWTTNSP
jgi:anthranilate synthase component 1